MQPRLAVLVGPQQAPLGVAQLAEDEIGAARAPPRGSRRAERRAGLGQGGDHQRVPGGQALVVEARPDPLRAGLVERRRGPPRGRAAASAVGAAGEVEDVGALEVAAFGDAEWAIAASARVARASSAISVATRRRSAPPRPRSRRRAPSRSRPRVRASRAAPSRASPCRPGGSARGRAPASRAGRSAPAGRCRRASSRSGGRARRRRPNSGRNRRRSGRRCLPPPSRRGSARRCSSTPAGEQELERRGRRELRGAAEAAVDRVGLPAQPVDRIVEDRRVERLRRSARSPRSRRAACGCAVPRRGSPRAGRRRPRSQPPSPAGSWASRGAGSGGK